MKPLFTRSRSNPILTVADVPVPCQAVLNPGAAIEDGRVALLIRVEDSRGLSNIHVARSDNGVDGWEVEPEPLLAYGEPDLRYEQWGCEDPRLVWLEELKSWVITYTAYSPAGAAVGLARSADLRSVERIGLVFPPNNKDAALFPERIGDRWAALHRPDAGNGIENIWIAFSHDLEYWGEPHCVLTEGVGPAWDNERVGAGPPPLRTPEGWLLLYHGVKMYGGRYVYRVGAALLDLQSPHRVTARTARSILIPSEPYEQFGLVPNVVFPTGLLLRGDELWMYYGAADTCVCLATAPMEDVLDKLRRTPR